MTRPADAPEPIGKASAPGPPVADAISVVIPTLGRDVLERCLEFLLHGDAWPVCLILVDQGENRAVVDWVAALRGKGMRVEHMRAPQQGRAAAVNRGLASVNSRFVAVTDDDCFVEAEWLSTMLARLEETPEAVVTGRVEPEGEHVVATVTAREPAVYRRPRLKHDSLSGGNMGAAIDLLRSIGPLDEDPCLASAEDCEYSYRILKRGVLIRYVPDVVVRHLGWRSASERADQYRTYARSHGGFLGKYLRCGDPFIAARTLVVMLRAAKRLILGLATGDADRVARGRAYLLGIWPGVAAGWRSEGGRPGGAGHEQDEGG